MTKPNYRYKHIVVQPETKERVRKFGLYGDSWDETINRICDMAEKANVGA